MSKTSGLFSRHQDFSWCPRVFSPQLSPTTVTSHIPGSPEFYCSGLGWARVNCAPSGALLLQLEVFLPARVLRSSVTPRGGHQPRARVTNKRQERDDNNGVSLDIINIMAHLGCLVTDVYNLWSRRTMEQGMILMM